MTKLNFKTSDPLVDKCDVLIVFADADFKKTAMAKKLDAAIGGGLHRLLEGKRFDAKAGGRMELVCAKKTPFASVVLSGTGEKPFASADAAIAAVGKEIKALRFAKGAEKINLVLPSASEALGAARLLYACGVGALAGAYNFSKKVLKPETVKINEINFFAPEIDAEKGENIIERAQIVGESVTDARDLVNEPANVCTPECLAQYARSAAKEYGMTAEIWDEKKCEKEGLSLFLAVGRGGANPPRFVKLAYAPKGKSKEKPVVIVGKGLCFDSGGLNVKTYEGMMAMKDDMAGSAAALAAMKAVARLKPDVPVVCLVAACENMPDGKSYKPGDVIVGKGGVAVEVLNTDAEGRLTLADALAVACDLEPAKIIDLATLTGAIGIALGDQTAGVFCNDETLAADLLNAAKTAGEDVWRMPLNPKMADAIKTPNADVKNVGDFGGGAITAALFLQYFVKNYPWAHMDIAGPAFFKREIGAFVRGGTGFGVLTLVELLAPMK